MRTKDIHSSHTDKDLLKSYKKYTTKLNSFIHQIFIENYVPGTILSFGNITLTKTHKSTCPYGTYSLLGKTDKSKQGSQT
jgi:hypothetical protein